MDMFGSAARAEAGRALHADIVAYHWRSPGRHLWVDVAITTPDTREALAAGSRDVPGTAARLRERKKHRKYGATCRAKILSLVDPFRLPGSERRGFTLSP